MLQVTQLLTMHLGPDFIVLAMKVAFAPDMQVGRVEEVIDEIERGIRGEHPEMKKIFIEPDSRGDERGVAAPLRAPGAGRAETNRRRDAAP